MAIAEQSVQVQIIPVCVACALVTAEGWAIGGDDWLLMPDVGQSDSVAAVRVPVLCDACKERLAAYCLSWDPDADPVNPEMDDVLRWLRIIGAYDRRRTA